VFKHPLILWTAIILIMNHPSDSTVFNYIVSPLQHIWDDNYIWWLYLVTLLKSMFTQATKEITEGVLCFLQRRVYGFIFRFVSAVLNRFSLPVRGSLFSPCILETWIIAFGLPALSESPFRLRCTQVWLLHFLPVSCKIHFLSRALLNSSRNFF